MEKNHLGLLCDIGELNALFAGSENIGEFLNQIVMLVTNHIHADVCSIYLYQDTTEELVLKATLGLNPRSVNRTRLKLGEGLVGTAVKEMTPICEKIASQNPHFKSIPGINEEPYESFLVVPIQRGIERIGALVVQRATDNDFSESDVMALKAITSQLAGAIASTRILMDLHSRRERKTNEPASDEYRIMKARVASEGMAFAPAVVIDEGKPYEFLKNFQYQKTYSIDDFEAAVEATETQLEEFQTQVKEKLAGIASLIFEAHLLMLKDTEFTGSMIKKINSGMNPPAAILAVADKYIEIFSRSGNAYTKEKSKDVEDLARRLFNNLIDEECKDVTLWEGRIVIARELYPSDVLKLSTEKVSGIILVSGGVTSHLSILARSLQIPMVIVDDRTLLRIQENRPILIDAKIGNVHLNPGKRIIAETKARIKSQSKIAAAAQSMEPETRTKDGIRVHLLANINLFMDLELAQSLQSEGVGLYRTEFAFMVSSNFPTEEEQIAVYSTLMDHMQGKMINIRTLDIGGEKVLAYYGDTNENNPTLGMRSIRFSLSHKELFQQQLRAILRAGKDTSELRITFPMISSVDEFLEARDEVRRAIVSLTKDKLVHYPDPEIGIMIETPSTIEIIDSLAQEADFLCIGTNDFVQYTLAVDRANAVVSSYYIPHHPAIIRSLKKIVVAAAAHGKDLSICGEMAHDEAYIPLLLGLGIRNLSIDPRYNPRVQRLVATVSIKRAEKLAAAVLAQPTVAGAAKELRITVD